MECVCENVRCWGCKIYMIWKFSPFAHAHAHTLNKISLFNRWQFILNDSITLQIICNLCVAGWLVEPRYTFFGPIQLLYAVYVHSFVRSYVCGCGYVYCICSIFFSLLGTLYLWTLSHLLFTFRTDCYLSISRPSRFGVPMSAHDQLHILYTFGLWSATHRNAVVVLVLLVMLLLLLLMRETVNYSFLWNLLLRLIWLGYMADLMLAMCDVEEKIRRK